MTTNVTTPFVRTPGSFVIVYKGTTELDIKNGVGHALVSPMTGFCDVCDPMCQTEEYGLGNEASFECYRCTFDDHNAWEAIYTEAAFTAKFLS